MSGPFSTPPEILKTMLSKSAAWQAWVGADTEEEAARKIFLEAMDYAASLDTVAEYTAHVAALRPFALISMGGELELRMLATHGASVGGTIDLQIEAAVPDHLQDNTQLSGSMLWFQKNLDGVISDLVAMAGEPDSLILRRISIVSGPGRTPVAEAENLGDHFYIDLSVQFGAEG